MFHFSHIYAEWTDHIRKTAKLRLRHWWHVQKDPGATSKKKRILNLVERIIYSIRNYVVPCPLKGDWMPLTNIQTDSSKPHYHFCCSLVTKLAMLAQLFQQRCITYYEFFSLQNWEQFWHRNFGNHHVKKNVFSMKK